MMVFFSKKHNEYFYLPVEWVESLRVVNKINLKSLFKKKQVNYCDLSIQKITSNLYYVFISFRCESDKLTFQEYLKRFQELYPPWVVFTNMFYGVPRWNQGYEEDYCVKYWIPYWNFLDKLSKNIYLEKYNCPKEWKEWLEEQEMFD